MNNLKPFPWREFVLYGMSTSQNIKKMLRTRQVYCKSHPAEFIAWFPVSAAFRFLKVSVKVLSFFLAYQSQSTPSKIASLFSLPPDYRNGSIGVDMTLTFRSQSAVPSTSSVENALNQALSSGQTSLNIVPGSIAARKYNNFCESKYANVLQSANVFLR